MTSAQAEPYLKIRPVAASPATGGLWALCRGWGPLPQAHTGAAGPLADRRGPLAGWHPGDPGCRCFREVWRGPRPAACRSPDESFRERVVNGCGVGAVPF